VIYLASPYSHPDPAIREARFDAACRATAEHLRAGRVVFSPIAYGHPLTAHGLRGDWSFWERFDRNVISRCDSVLVLMLDGWQESVGVRAEIDIAIDLGKPVAFTMATAEVPR